MRSARSDKIDLSGDFARGIWKRSPTPITLFSADGIAEQTVDALVDVDTTFTVIPSPILDRLGIESHRSVRLRRPNGQEEERRIGQVMAEFAGVERSVQCVFADADDPSIIGMVTLEAFLLKPDQKKKRLERVVGCL